MAPRPRISRSFKLEGSRAELQRLMATINKALESEVRGSEPVIAEGRIGLLGIEVRVRNTGGALAVRPDSRDEAAVLLEGWAENKKCVSCEIPVALLFEEAYLESSTGRGPVCARCMNDELDRDQSI